MPTNTNMMSICSRTLAAISLSCSNTCSRSSCSITSRCGELGSSVCRHCLIRPVLTCELMLSKSLMSKQFSDKLLKELRYTNVATAGQAVQEGLVKHGQYPMHWFSNTATRLGAAFSLNAKNHARQRWKQFEFGLVLQLLEQVQQTVIKFVL